MRGLLYAAAALVFLAGVQLYLLTEHTATYFAWTVAPPITAAFLGAAYWAAVPVEVMAARSLSWDRARAAIPGIWLFTTLTFVATLIHFGRFHFDSPSVAPRTAAWLWLGIYTVVPVGLVLVGILQLRRGGPDPERVAILPLVIRGALVGVGGGMTAIGAALFALPVALLPVWPWALTPITARAIGAWLLGSGIAAFVAYRENDLVRIRPIGAGFTVFGLLELVTVARYPGEIMWGRLSTWIYLVFLIVLLPIGLFVWFAQRRVDASVGSSR